MREQIASHMYQRQLPAATPLIKEPEAQVQEERKGVKDHQPAPEVTQQTQRRVVTIPTIDPSTAWNIFSERQERLWRERAKSPKYTAVVQRAHAQYASSGRIGIIRRLPPVPDRSGRRAARRALWLRLLSFLSIVVALLLATRFALTSSAFRIEQVNVTGTNNPALIGAIQRMGMQGQNIFLLNVAALTDRIEASPLVASVSLSKQWPNALTVTVVERQPALLWQTAEGTYSVDAQGMVIAPVSETTGIDHLNIVIDTGSQQPGQQANTRPPVSPGTHLHQADITFALNVFAYLPQVTGITAFQLRYDDTMDTSSTVGAGISGGGSFIVESSAGWIAYLGGASDTNPLENRLIELQQILALAQQQQLSLATIDLRYGLRPVYTLKQ